MRIAVRGRNLAGLLPLLEARGVDCVEESPDLVISYGGDGALLGAEREFPGIPKCPVRDSPSNPKCPRHGEDAILDLLFSGELPETRLTKVQATVGSEVRAIGLNDIVISRRLIPSAVRYRIWLDGELYASQIVGDGLVVSTPFGSTGYYRSITNSLFRLGLGLAFNNSAEPVNHLVIAEDSEVAVLILRGPATLVADNDPQQAPLNTGDVVTLKKTAGGAVIHGLDIFRCPDCHKLRQNQDVPK